MIRYNNLMKKLISKKDLVSKHSQPETVHESLESVNDHLITMNKLGFTNASIYLKKEKSGLIIQKLQEAGYRVFGEVNAYKDNTVEIEWF